ncbi:MAG: hypothetical protein GX144_10525 [Clostridiaceae bacterium]|nr:hypothetical protein [Clostridiaceae bacterium]
MKKSVVYGAGNIGRGFIGQLFSESGYEVVFIDINQELVDRLNSNGKYPVQILDPRENKEFYVENVRAVNGRCLSVSAEEISNADIMATSVGVNILPEIAKTIAAGLKKRWRDGNTEPLNIIICENLIGANLLLAQWIGNDLDTSE